MKTIKVCILPFWAQDFLYRGEFKFDEGIWCLQSMANYIIDRSDWSGDEIDSLYTEGQCFIKYLTGWENLAPKDTFKFDWDEE